jgi:hypothetical protein
MYGGRVLFGRLMDLGQLRHGGDILNAVRAVMRRGRRSLRLRSVAHHRTQDRVAIDARIRAHNAHGQREEFMASLASLPIGHGLVLVAGSTP